MTSIEIPESYLKGMDSSEFIAMPIKGNGYSPEFQDGDYLLIHKQHAITAEGFGVVEYDNRKAELKRVKPNETEPGYIFSPVNPQSETETVEEITLDRCRIIGIPVVLIREYNSTIL